MNKNVVNLWFTIDIELHDIFRNMQENMDLNETNYDYEDTWEWCELYDNIKKINYNISRKHDGEKGIYDYPVRVMITKNNDMLSDEEIDTIAMNISNMLDVEVYYGNVNYIKGDEFEFVSKKKYFK